MTDLQLNASKTAVLAMDFQQLVISSLPAAQGANLMQKVKAVLDGARQAGLPLIHVVLQFREGYPEVSSRNRMFSGLKQMGLFGAGHDDGKIADSLGPVKGDIIVSRPRVNAFYNSDLQSILSSKGVDTVVLMGIATNFVVEGTARHAVDADYRVIVLEDCCAGTTVEAHQGSISHVLSQLAEVATSEDFLSSLKRASR
ncbi:MAG: cysteine hydrolase [Chloroflexi bacterium]|nr:cysteine hydrolase [Chloroflexota bacterium]